MTLLLLGPFQGSRAPGLWTLPPPQRPVGGREPCALRPARGPPCRVRVRVSTRPNPLGPPAAV